MFTVKEKEKLCEELNCDENDLEAAIKNCNHNKECIQQYINKLKSDRQNLRIKKEQERVARNKKMQDVFFEKQKSLKENHDSVNSSWSHEGTMIPAEENKICKNKSEEIYTNSSSPAGIDKSIYEGNGTVNKDGLEDEDDGYSPK